MLLLFPIVLWWAKAPMRFAHGRSKRVLSTIIISCFAIMASQAAMADDRQGRDDPNAADEKVDTAEAGKIARDGSPNVLREGTQIPPTKGQIVMLGRRWVFIVESPEKEEVDKGFVFDRRENRPEKTNASREPAAPSNIAALKNRYGNPDSHGNRGNVGGSSIEAGNSRSMLGPFSLVATGERHTDATNASKSSTNRTRLAGTTIKAKQFSLAENLSLQRIVESLRADASDDQWILSGEVSEFFGDNSLTIRTAQRSNHN